MAIAFVLAGTPQSGVGSITPAWPAHVAGDVALLIVQTTGGQPASLTTPNGFAAVANSPQATGSTTAGSQVTVYWCRATSNAMAAPVVADSGNHQLAIIITFSGVAPTGNPWNVTAGSVKATTSTSGGVTGMITTVANTALVCIITSNVSTANEYSSWGTYAEVVDTATTAGVGGSIGVAWKTQAAAGSTGTVACALATSAINANLFIALRPALTQSVDAAMTPAAASLPRPVTKGLSASLGANIATVFQYLAGDSLASGYSFARALAAYEVASGGLLQLIATGTARDADYSYGVRGLLLEPARTNKAKDSVLIGASTNWSKNSSVVSSPVVTDNIATDPVGTAASASRVVLPAVTGSGAYSVVSQPVTSPAGSQAQTVYLKGDVGGEVVYISATTDGITYATTRCVLTTSWVRYTNMHTIASPFFQVGVDLRDTVNEVAQAAQTFYMWVPVLEESAPYPTSAISQTSALVTRPADVLTFTVPGGAGQVGTLYEKYYDMATGSLVEQVSPLTTSATYVPATGRVWLGWKFALGTQSLAAMQAASPTGGTPTMSATLTPAKVTGGNTPVAVAAGMTPTAAALVRTSQLPLAAALAPAVAIGRKAAKAPGAAITPAAALARTPARSLAASLSPTVAIARKVAKSPSGSMSPTATIARSLARTLAASASPGGALARTGAKAPAGAITPSGALAEAHSRPLAIAAAMTPAVALVRTPTRAIAAVETPSAALAKGDRKAPAATMTPAGAESRAVALPLVGAIAPAAALGRQPARAMAAAITPLSSALVGGFNKTTNRPLAATIGPTAALNRTDARALAAAIAAAGALVRGQAYARAIAGSIAPVAALNRTPGKVASGSIAPTAALARSTAMPLAASLAAAVALSRGSFYTRSLSASIAAGASLARSTGKAPAATIAAAGAISRVTLKLLAASLVPDGSVAPSSGRVVLIDASVTPSTALGRQDRVVILATIAPAGATARFAIRQIGAAILPAGAAARRTDRATAGAIGPAGTLDNGRFLFVDIAALIGSDGALLRSTAKRLPATLAGGGSLAAVGLTGVRARAIAVLALFRAIR